MKNQTPNTPAATTANTAAIAAEPTNAPLLHTKHLAARFGMKATALRRVLRSMPAYADGVHTNYRWAGDDKRIADIESAIKKLATEKQERAAAAKEALDKRIAATAAQAKVDATAKA